jgi:sortase A
LPASKPQGPRRGTLKSALRILGWTLLLSGLVLLEFAAYLAWGTGLTASREQRRLRDTFEQLRISAQAGSTGNANAVEWRVSEGEPIGRLEIPAIEVDAIVLEGVGHDVLAKGPGHIPETVLPGHAGNSVISGHRTTYGAPFWNLDRLQPGDEIIVTTVEGMSKYRVTSTYVVFPNDTSVTAPLKPGEKSRLRLTTCHPRFSASRRLVVEAELVKGPREEGPCISCAAGSALA